MTNITTKLPEPLKVFCHMCDGDGYVEEATYPSRKVIRVTCPECNGRKWVTTLREFEGGDI